MLKGLKVEVLSSVGLTLVSSTQPLLILARVLKPELLWMFLLQYHMLGF
jgi:hypothetical protein